MRLFLLDRDGVLVVNKPTPIKTPRQLELVCPNQPEVDRGAMTSEQLAAVHQGLDRLLAERGARIDQIFCCTSDGESPLRKPAGGMLRQALAEFGAEPAQTAFVGDQLDDLKAAFHAGCRRVLVLTGLGRKSLERGLPDYLQPVGVFADLGAAVDAELGDHAHAQLPAA
jgi:D-glycero-D-manno-heptose 1,7-bisphosphate phosphatase